MSSKQVIEAPWSITKNIVDSGMKMLTPTFLQFILAFFVIDFFVYMWDYAAVFQPWRDNAQAEKVRKTLDTSFSTEQDSNGRLFILALVYGIAAYISAKKYGRNVKALSGPVAIAVICILIQYFMRLGDKFQMENGDDSCNGDTSVGCEIQFWVSSWINQVFLGDQYDNDTNTIIVVATLLGYMASI